MREDRLMNDEAPVQRRNTAWVAETERRTLVWIAARLPPAVTPNTLTAIGMLGALIAMLGYFLAAGRPAMLWLASAGFVLNWFGDSLDGTLARVRGIERPHFGFFLDKSTDVLADALFAVGLGLSTFIGWKVAMGGLAAFFMVSILSLIRVGAGRNFDIAYFGIGMTETRCGLVLLNSAIYFFPPQPIEAFGMSFTYPNLLGVLWIAGHVSVFLVVMIAEARRLAVADPPRVTAGGARSRAEQRGTSERLREIGIERLGSSAKVLYTTSAGIVRPESDLIGD
jgi:archaetidylinositol phosphate synthase